MSANEKRPVIEVAGAEKSKYNGSDQDCGRRHGCTQRTCKAGGPRVRGKEDPNTVIGTEPAAVRPDVYGAERR